MFDTVRTLSGQAVYVTIELPDGSILAGKTAVASVSVSREHHNLASLCDDDNAQCFGKLSWSIELHGVGKLERRGEFRERVWSKAEWMCPYCMVPNDLKKQRCQACGAWRPFALGG